MTQVFERKQVREQGKIKTMIQEQREEMKRAEERCKQQFEQAQVQHEKRTRENKLIEEALEEMGNQKLLLEAATANVKSSMAATDRLRKQVWRSMESYARNNWDALSEKQQHDFRGIQETLRDQFANWPSGDNSVAVDRQSVSSEVSQQPGCACIVM